jgi:hypothetical protein
MYMTLSAGLGGPMSLNHYEGIPLRLLGPTPDPDQKGPVRRVRIGRAALEERQALVVGHPPRLSRARLQTHAEITLQLLLLGERPQGFQILRRHALLGLDFHGRMIPDDELHLEA